MRSKQSPHTSADQEFRARVRAILREITLPREVAEGLGADELLPLSIPVTFKRKRARS